MIRILIALIIVFCLTGSVWGADAKQQLQGIKKEIKEKKLLINKTVRVENVVTGELARINQNLKEQQSSLVVLDRDLQSVEKNLENTGSAIQSVKTGIEDKKLLIQKRLVAIYKAGYVGDIRFFFSAETFPRMLEDRRYMKSLVENDRKMLSDYNARIENLRSLQGNLAREATKKEKIKSNIELKKNEIEAEKRKKAVYLAKVQQDKKNYQASLRELEANSKRLQAIVQRLEAISRKRLAREKAAAGKVVKKGVDSPPPSSEKGFGAQKGRLSMPLRGRLISGFGRHKHAQFNSYTVNNGISIAAPVGADVRAIYDGTVIFAEYFKGYGNMVIVDHGGGYFSLYAHNSRIAKRAGTSVAKNDILASVGDIDSANGPMLYFEIRYQGKPVDPSAWVR
ncbi:MAG: zinc metalloendopeptidase domain protein [Geobacteraceae bacterium]|nr:zinc metalloendopeptidase domain protein [Geobacteraceae bacterium]